MDLDLATFAPAIEAIGKAGLPLLEQGLTAALSTAATATTGPFGLLVSPVLNTLWPAVNGALGLPDAAEPAATAAAIAADPRAAKAKLGAVQERHAALLETLKERDATALSALQAQSQADRSADAAQDAINARAAESASFFVYGYRPAIVWGLGAVLLLYSGAPLFGWFVAPFGWRLGEAPALPWYVLVLIAALLGVVAALRSWDKANGTAPLPPAAPNASAAAAIRR